jgi:hypothetical protein
LRTIGATGGSTRTFLLAAAIVPIGWPVAIGLTTLCVRDGRTPC